MAEKIYELNSGKLSISGYSENIIRIRVSKDFKPSLFERYGIYHPSDNAGEETAFGVKSGDITAEYKDGVITFTTPKCSRQIEIGKNPAEMRSYFDEELSGLRPDYRQIIGDEAKRNYGTVDFEKDPKYIVIKTGDEKFYGLGEANDDRLVLNGKTYLERVVYQRNEIPIPFIMTKAGYGILCNSTFWHAVDVCKKNPGEIVWYLPDGDIDFMVFAGDRLSDIQERFTYVTGRPMLMPKWAYGLTFTEQYYADQFEIMHTAERFRQEKLPCDMISLEPGWMAKRYDFSVDKKWNTEKFFINDWARSDSPENTNPAFFTSALKRKGFKTQLWLCSTHDFTAHEENLAGNDTDFGIPAWFDHLKKFVNDGANSFKVDPCHVCDSSDEGRVYANGKAEPEMHNLMQTLCTKEMYQGHKAHANRRPMNHFCGGYTGTGAYSAATTGDNGGGRKSMSWMLNLGIASFSNVSCDMYIHKKDTIHYGFLMAWSQLDAWSGFNHPWYADEENEKIFRFYDNLHYHLTPYQYSAAIKCNMTGTPVCAAMPLMFDDEECENSLNEYMYGESLLSVAFTNNVYLPRGHKWIDCWTGKVYEGGTRFEYEIPEDRGGALFIRGGAIIPTQDGLQYIDCKDPEKLNLEIFPEGESTYTFFEDDGVSCEYEEGKRAQTVICCKEDKDSVTVTVGPRTGSFSGMVKNRWYTVKVFAGKKPMSVTVDGSHVDFTYDGHFAIFDILCKGTAKIQY